LLDKGFESRSGHGCLCLYVVSSYVDRGLWEEPIAHPKKSYHVSNKIQKKKRKWHLKMSIHVLIRKKPSI
jgi:hypothetical protein